MVKDKISLIAAAAGGFMLFVALTGILQGSPVTALRMQHNFDSTKSTLNKKAALRKSEKRFPAFADYVKIAN